MLQTLKETWQRVCGTPSGGRVAPALPPPTAAELAAIDALRRRAGALARAQGGERAGSHALWQVHLQRFRELLQTADPREFLRWDVVRRTMFGGSQSYVQPELDALRGLEDWETRWRPAIRESAVGRPKRYGAYPESSGNLIHHAYHLARFEAVTRRRVDALQRVFEFGGGYGSMCRLFRQLGFRGQYVMYDFPEFAALQEFFLRSLDIPVAADLAATGSTGAALCLSDLPALRTVLADWRGRPDTLFLATWSISETPLETRNVILPLVSACACYLIAYQHEIPALNNREFFTRWAAEQADVAWQHTDIEHLPGSAYLIGARRSRSVP